MPNNQQAFDPDKYLAEKQALITNSFDPDKYLAEKQALIKAELPTREPVNASESFLRGLGQGASFGFSDELGAGIEAGYNKAKGLVGAGPKVDLIDEYNKSLNVGRARNDAAKADNPITYGAGTVGGGILSTLVPATLIPKLGAAMGGTALARYGSAASLGALGGLGYSEGDLSSLDKAKELLKDTATGAGVGVVAQGLGDVVGKVASNFKPSNLEKIGDARTLKQAGYIGKDLKNLSESEKSQIASVLRDSGAVKPFKSLENVADDAIKARNVAGEEIGNSLGNIDNLVSKAYSLVDEGKFGNMPDAGKDNLKKAISDQFSFNMRNFGNSLEEKLIKPNEGNPFLKNEVSKLRTYVEDLRNSPNISLKEANKIKTTLGKITKFNSDTVPQAFKKELYDEFKNALENSVNKAGILENAIAKAESGGRALGNIDVAGRNQSALDAYVKAKQNYGALKGAEKVASQRIGMAQGNRDISLTDTIMAAGGMASGNPVGGLALGALNKLWRQNESTIVGGTARTAAKILNTVPELLGPYAAVLENAAKNGGVGGIRAAHLDLLKNPNYQRILSEYEKSDSYKKPLEFDAQMETMKRKIDKNSQSH